MSSEQVANPAGPVAQPVAGPGPYSPYQTSTRWGPGAAMLVAMLIYAVTQALAAGALYAFSDAASLEAGRMPKTGGVVMGLWLLTQLLMCGCVLLALWWKGDRIAEALAWKAPVGSLPSYLKELGVLLIIVAIYSFVSLTFFRSETRADMKAMAEIIRGPAWPLALAVVSIGAPLSEEVLARGFMQTALVQTRLGYWGASFVTSGLWALMHFQYSWVGLLEVFLIGLVFCAILRRTGSLRVTIFGHAVYNCLVALAMIFLPKEWLGF